MDKFKFFSREDLALVSGFVAGFSTGVTLLFLAECLLYLILSGMGVI